MLGVPFEEWSAQALLSAFRDGRASPAEVADGYLRRIERCDTLLHAFVTVDPPRVAAAAAQSAARYMAGTPRPLEGLPIAVKDLIDTAGLRTTYGSGIYRNHVPAADASVVTILRKAGAIVLGKTATHEFAWGIMTDGHAYGPTRNPWDAARTAGGSSGGSAVAVAARLAPVALGTDTVGSVRIPAAFCGAVGFKPTFGTVSADGVFRLAPSLDHIGLIARTVTDVQLLWTVLGPCRPDSSDRRGLDGIRVGAWMPTQAGPGRSAVTRVRELLNAAGVPSKLTAELATDALAVAGAIVGFQGLRVHRQAGLWPARRSEYEPDVAARLSSAERLTDDDYASAQLARTAVRQQVAEIFQVFDVVISPVSLAQPIRLDDRGDDTIAKFRQAVMSQTAAASVAGAPSVTVPVGFDENGLPLGVQLMAAPGRDEFLLDVAASITEALSAPAGSAGMAAR